MQLVNNLYRSISSLKSSALFPSILSSANFSVVFEIEKKLIEENLDKKKFTDEKTKLVS